jgi:hypothetical protein
VLDLFSEAWHVSTTLLQIESQFQVLTLESKIGFLQRSVRLLQLLQFVSHSAASLWMQTEAQLVYHKLRLQGTASISILKEV